jgi:hypothetical protein
MDLCISKNIHLRYSTELYASAQLPIACIIIPMWPGDFNLKLIWLYLASPYMSGAKSWDLKLRTYAL